MEENKEPIILYPQGNGQTTFTKKEEKRAVIDLSKGEVPVKKRITYPQKWHEYNLAQTQEKKMFLKLLDGLVNSLGITTISKKTGRPPVRIDSMIKCCGIKVFNNFSSRRITYDLEIAQALHYIDFVPHFNTLLKYLDSPAITPYLYQMIDMTASVLAPYETKFAVDSTGITTFNYDNWNKVRLHFKKHKNYKKLHISIGVNTNIITSVKITDGEEADSPHFKELINKISKKFTIKEISADAGYLSEDNAQAVEELGAKPYIKVKSNTNFSKKGLGAWGRMLRAIEDNKIKYEAKYHKRSNIESTNSSFKRKFTP